MNITNSTQLTCSYAAFPALAASIKTFTTFAVIITVVALLFSLAVRALERALERLHPYLRKALSRLYQELTVCGLISLIFLIFYHACLDGKLAMALGEDPALVEAVFHYFHLWVFVLFGFYVILVLLQMCFTIMRTRMWKGYEDIPISVARSTYEDLQLEARRMSCMASIFNLRFRYRSLSASSLIRFHFLRVRYIQKHALSERFSFADFLTRRLEKECAHALRTHWTFWILLLAIILLNYARYVAIGAAEDDTRFVRIGFIILGWVLLTGGLVLQAVLGMMMLRVSDPERPTDSAAASKKDPEAAAAAATLAEPDLQSGGDLSYRLMDGGGIGADQKKVVSVGGGPGVAIQAWVRSLTGLLFAKTLFQTMVFCVVLFCTMLMMYGIATMAVWPESVVAILPVVLFVLVPLPQVLPLYTLLTVLSHPPDVRTGDVQLDEMGYRTSTSATGGAGGGLGGSGGGLGVLQGASSGLSLSTGPSGIALRYTPMLQSPYETPSQALPQPPPPLTRPGTGGGFGGKRGGPQGGLPAQDDFFGLRGGSYD